MAITLTIPTVNLGFLKRHWKKILLIILIGLPVAGIAAFLFSPKEPEYVTDVVRRGGLLQTVEAVGEVISERDLKLQFPVTGIVDRVFVQEGDTVRAGQELARLRSGGLGADVNAASARVASAKAEYDELVRGSRPEEINIAEAQVANSRASLDAAKTTLATAESQLRNSEIKLQVLRAEADTALRGDVIAAGSAINQQLTSVLTALRTIDDVLADNDVQDALIRSNSSAATDITNAKRAAEQDVMSAMAGASSLDGYTEAIAALQRATAAATSASAALQRTYDEIASLALTSYFTASDREAHKSSLATQRGTVQTALTALSASLTSLRTSSATYSTRIAAEEASLSSAIGTRDKAQADIASFEASLRIQEAQLALTRAGATQEAIDASRGRLNQAYADLQRARERYSDTIIRAPIAGSVTKVNLKEGELLSTSFASDAAITMLGDAPYRIEMFIAEIDIPRVRLGQSGSILLDAFPGNPFDLLLTELDPAATIVDGVPKYRAKLDFVNQDERIRIGMTGDAEIRTDFREDTLIIPGRAVFVNEQGERVVRVLTDEGMVEEFEVETGMEGTGGDLEVTAGLNEGQTIVVLVKE